MELIELVKTFGLAAALVIFLMIKEARKEKRQEEQAIERETQNNERFSDLEKFCRSELLNTCKAATEATVNSTEACKKSTEAIERNTEVLQQCKAFLSKGE